MSFRGHFEVFRALASAIFSVLFLLGAATSTLGGVASEVVIGDGVAVWLLYGEEIWRFPISSEVDARSASDALNGVLSSGFSLSDLRVARRDDRWFLQVGRRDLIEAQSDHSGLLRLPPKFVALLMLSRIYDVLGKGAPVGMDERFTLRGGRTAEGTISWYGGESMIGRKFANGEVCSGNELVAAAKDLPFGTLLRIKNLASGKTVVVRVVDRFREHRGRILDVSRAAAELLGFKSQGVAKVLVEVIGHVKRVGGR
ncbi:lipoprotein [Thermanaerovibrio velox DSM 12556]|uniref:Probable endolytic peptidoglycan transglycosylase RlpA n=1 Tax=Thermanaerovibrio velox DSM 12556 TaxID=926567 RepID=H0URK9_9BACT|nr:lipoprotein [Thermanaerovibrio velox DSM 12556]